MTDPFDNEFLELLHIEAEAVAAFWGLPRHTARDLARSLCERVMLRAGGDIAYIQNGHDRRRQAALEALDDGASPSEVCRRFGVARRTLRRWVQQGKVSGTCQTARPLVPGRSEPGDG